MVATALQTRTLTTTEAAVLAVLAMDGERSGYDLLKRMSTIGYVWAPAKSQLYAVLPRLSRDGLAHSRAVAQSTRPDKHVYRMTVDGRAALDAWFRTVEPGSTDAFFLRLFVGGLTSSDVLIAHVQAFRDNAQLRLDELRAIEPTNEQSGNDFLHYFVLRLGIERAEQSVTWAEWVLAELRSSG